MPELIVAGFTAVLTLAVVLLLIQAGKVERPARPAQQTGTVIFAPARTAENDRAKNTGAPQQAAEDRQNPVDIRPSGSAGEAKTAEPAVTATDNIGATGKKN